MQRPNRSLERSDTMSKGKRILDRSEVEEDHFEPKRLKVPALASVIVEALKVDSLQKLCSSLEPILRRVVSEEVERAVAKLVPARLGGRSSSKRIEGPDGRNLQLHFRSKLSLPLFTGGKVEGEQRVPIHVVLLDANTDRVVMSGPESSLKLDVVVLDGDFNNEDDEDWTREDFESHVVKEREGKRPLLTGELQMTLNEGVGTLGEVTFTDNSSWIRSRKFRLGLKVASGFCEGIRVREAKTDAFTVKDHRGELYKKHHPPALNDEVWRLEKIGKDGSFHKKLNDAGIRTVEDFLRTLVRDTQRLRTILGSGMSNKMWEVLVEHSKTCVLSEKLYIYYSSSDDQRNVGVVFNDIYELRGLIVGEQYYSADYLTGSQKVCVDALVKKAYENWMHVVEYDGKELVNFKQSKGVNVSRNELPMGPSDHSFSFDQQLPLPHLSVVVPPDQVLVDSGLIFGGCSVSSGYNGNLALRYPICSPQIQSESIPIPPQSQLISSSHQTQIPRNDSLIGLALYSPPLPSNGFHTVGPSSCPSELNNPYDDYLSEEEIRIRSHEMLENEDMQHLLRFVNIGGSSVNGPEDGFHFVSSPLLNFNFDDDHIRSSGKAVVGWLKLKAALRWGIFIRKKAAEKRAQLVELEY